MHPLTGWQGVFLQCVLEFIKVVSPLTDPTAHGGNAWARRAYRNLIYFHQADKGGHFAAWEQPQLFTEELRTAFRSLR